MGHDEMKSNVKQLARLQAGLEQARDDLEGINEEKRLLEWEQSVFPQLNTMFQLKEPYDKLWNTAWTFHQKHEHWMNGPFTSLNAEEIENEVDDMWRTMYKLTKTFGDQPGPRRIADSVKGKIDKFKQHLHRYFTSFVTLVYEIVTGRRDNYLNYYTGWRRLVQLRLEYSLEKALEKMTFEWQDMCFKLIPYRETRFHPNISGKDTERMLEIEGFDGIKNLTYLNS